jgi:hypothetical protein
MTTPERIRRRQRIEGGVLILLAIFTVIQGVAFSLEDRDQTRCMEDKFRELSVALDARGDLTERETEATRRVWRVYGKAAGLASQDASNELSEEQESRLRAELVAALLNYQDEARAIQAERKENPLPPYPVGSCDR